MAPKHPNPDAKSSEKDKKAKKVRVEHLADGPWRRKIVKDQKERAHKSKLEKKYAKVKAKEKEEKKAAAASDDAAAPNDENDGQTLHPTRQLMLKDEEAAQTGATSDGFDPDGQRRRTRRPGYYDKQLEKAEQKRQEQEERALEAQRRREEREKKVAERERYKRAMKKTWGRDGKKKLGRESGLLLERVRKMVEK